MNKNNKIPKFSLSWLYFIIGGALLFIYLFDDGNANQEMVKPYSEVEDYIKNGYVEEISVINNSTLEAYIIKDSVAAVTGKPATDGTRLKVKTTIGSIDNFDNFIREQRENEEAKFKGLWLIIKFLLLFLLQTFS